ncbi:MAG TPA: TetR/AcrR family transcriptional regulator [Rhizomicrobium sp.]|nr:TetR/AcrR family transcriptional regulator [Rhizomicrobium sp.]
MAKPKSEEKRNAIMSAAARVIASQGLGAPTAVIAQEAGVANGTLFTYFETKADLFNELYVALKAERASASLKGLPVTADLRKQMFHLWSHAMDWAMTHPEKRRALAQLSVSDEISEASRAAGHKAMSGVARLLEQSRAGGVMRNAPMGFVVAIMNSVGDATMEFMTQDPVNAKKHAKAGFDALWRVLT